VASYKARELHVRPTPSTIDFSPTPPVQVQTFSNTQQQEEVYDSNMAAPAENNIRNLNGVWALVCPTNPQIGYDTHFFHRTRPSLTRPTPSLLCKVSVGSSAKSLAP
jgi:hypothetical protein